MTQSIEFSAPAPLINANSRLDRRAVARLTKEWRTATALYARKLSPVPRAQVTITVSFTDRIRRDVGNLQPTAKAIVDGLVDAHILVDDNDRYLIGPDLRTGSVWAGQVTRWRVEITELEPVAEQVSA